MDRIGSLIQHLAVAPIILFILRDSIAKLIKLNFNGICLTWPHNMVLSQLSLLSQRLVYITITMPSSCPSTDHITDVNDRYLLIRHTARSGGPRTQPRQGRINQPDTPR